MSERFWSQYYPSDVPADIDPHAYESLVDLFEKSCAKFSDCSAISNYGCSLTYAQLNEKSRHFAAYLQNKLGLQKGARVAIMLPNILQYYVALFGILRAGLIVVNVNPLYTPHELEHQLLDSGAKTILVMSNFAHTLEQAIPNLHLEHIIITNMGDLFPFPKAQVVNFMVKHIKKLVRPYRIPQAISFNQLMKVGETMAFNKVDIQYQDIAFLQYTGGTTGISKGAILSHGNMLANVEQTLAWFGNALKPGEEVIMTPLPLYHIFSLTVCALTFIKIGGVSVLITNPRDISHFIKELAHVKFTVFVGINTLFNALVNQPDFAKCDFSHLRLTVTGGMALQQVVADKWHKITGNHILEGYGLTEASPVVAVNPGNISGFTGSVGMPLPSTDVSIHDEDGNEIPMSEDGELWVKGPQVMSGYWRHDGETKKVLSADGWLKTGDIAHLDEKGLIYIVDRKKDMILVSGFNVYPNEVEAVIAEHPGVLEVAVIGIADEHSGEAVKAFVVKKDPSLTAEQIVLFCRKSLTGYKIPKFIEFRDELPKSNVGKILRRKLRGL